MSNIHAGWFSLTEEYVRCNPGPVRAGHPHHAHAPFKFPNSPRARAPPWSLQLDRSIDRVAVACYTAPYVSVSTTSPDAVAERAGARRTYAVHSSTHHRAVRALPASASGLGNEPTEITWFSASRPDRKSPRFPPGGFTVRAVAAIHASTTTVSTAPRAEIARKKIL